VTQEMVEDALCKSAIKSGRYIVHYIHNNNIIIIIIINIIYLCEYVCVCVCV